MWQTVVKIDIQILRVNGWKNETFLGRFLTFSSTPFCPCPVPLSVLSWAPFYHCLGSFFVLFLAPLSLLLIPFLSFTWAVHRFRYGLNSYWTKHGMFAVYFLKRCSNCSRDITVAFSSCSEPGSVAAWQCQWRSDDSVCPDLSFRV